ncbi:adenylate/guanylate cyclase domain-containing protein [Aeromicrobium alkaliterrae]|uniref:Adenylate/guanylate cyclase domain-containing protein n=1 Tax=Aeromicrobium alkaliterrae TaxID=302168 RepID=A0ABN2JRL4_9ACTN
MAPDSAAARETRRSRVSFVWRLRVAMVTGLVLTSVVGAVIVYCLATLVIPLPIANDDDLAIVNLVTVSIVVPVLLTTGIIAGLRISAPALRWVRQDRPPTDAEKRAVLDVPRRFFVLHAVLWAMGALFFAIFNAVVSVQLGVTVLQVVGLAGITTSSVAYLVSERLTRGLAGRALASGIPESLRVRSVANRTMFAWMLGTGVVVWGIGAVGLASLVRRDDVTVVQLSITMLVLGSLGFVVGGFTIYVAARASSDPVRVLRNAISQVGAGDLEARSPIYDGTEIGLLQAGFNEMVAGLREREQLRDLFGRHVGGDVARAAAAGGVRLGGEARHVVVLFVDVIGSTAIAAQRPPEEVVSLLNRFFTVVIEVVHDHDGWINKFEGDAALAIWNAPVEVDAPEEKALTAARVMAARLAGEVPELAAAIGVSGGRAVAGNVGAAERYEYTVIGDPVNEASRLTARAQQLPPSHVAANAGLLDAAGDEAEHWREVEPFVARGRTEPTRVAAPAD